MSTHFFGLKDWTFSYSHTVGRNEFAGTGFRNPVDLAVAADDVLYVVSRSSDYRTDGVRITVCTLNEEYISEFGSYGEGDGQFTWPASIAVDSQDRVYLADEWLNRITIFDKDGEFLGKWGTPGSGDGQVDRPAGLAINTDGTIFLSDARNHRVQKFTLDGQYLGQFGSFGSGPGQLNMPWGVSLDKDGNVFVADWRNDRVQHFTAEGRWLASFGQSGSAAGEFNRPSSVCADGDGIIYVADRQNDRVQALAPDGRFMAEFTGDSVLSQWGKDKLNSNPDMIRQRALAVAYDHGNFEKAFGHPCAVKIDNHGRLLALDNARGRIQIYQKTKDPVLV